MSTFEEASLWDMSMESRATFSGDFSIFTLSHPGTTTEESLQVPDFLVFRPWGRLDSTLSKFFLCVMDETINELDVLNGMYVTEAGALDLKDISYKSPYKRFGLDAAAKFEDFRLNTVLSNVHMVHASLCQMYTCLTHLRNEMAESETFNTLVDFSRNYNKTYIDNVEMIRSLKSQRRHRKFLRNARVELRAKGGDILSKIGNNICELKNVFEDERERNTYEKLFAHKWQYARIEQNRIILKDKEDVFNKVIHGGNDNTEDENFLHQDILKFMDEVKNDHETEIEQWMERYDHELETRENNITQLRVNYEKLQEEDEKLKTEFERRKTQIAEYLEHKRLKRLEEERRKLEIWAATKIQAWWRGTMVRRKLGPYRKKKGGKKDKKGKGGKKGKGKK